MTTEPQKQLLHIICGRICQGNGSVWTFGRGHESFDIGPKRKMHGRALGIRRGGQSGERLDESNSLTDTNLVY